MTELERAKQNRKIVGQKLYIEAYLKQEEAVRGTPFDHPLPHHVKVAEHNPARLLKLDEGFGYPCNV